MDKKIQVGDPYRLTSLSYFLHLEDGGSEDSFPEEEKYYECTVKYITPEGGLILGLNAPGKVHDDTFDTCLFSGKEIKAEYPDFDGPVDAEYIVPHYDGCPFY